MIANEKKIVPGVEVGDQVAVWYDSRTDQKMYGVVTENDAIKCVIKRTDEQQIVKHGQHGFGIVKNGFEIIIFGDTATDVGRVLPGVNVEKV